MASLVVLACIATTVSGGAVELTKANFKGHVLDSGKGALVKFLAPW